MKNKIILILGFIIYTILIKTCPAMTLWDKSVIIAVQNLLKDIPTYIPLLPDCKLYSFMIALPLLAGSIYFLKKKDVFAAVFLCTVPLVTFILNCIIKPIIQRSRPPVELQLVIHPHSFSYVSSHSLVTTCLYGIIIFYFWKFCKNKYLKYSIIFLSTIWILFVGLSRIWLGVHYPSDVLGAYILGFILFLVYSKILIQRF